MAFRPLFVGFSAGWSFLPHGFAESDIIPIAACSSQDWSKDWSQLILIPAPNNRLITVATRCIFSFGSADGLNDLLLTPDDPHGDWRQPVSVLHRDALMMAALRVSILLDRDDQMLSFQSVHRLLKDPSVVVALLQALEDRYGRPLQGLNDWV